MLDVVADAEGNRHGICRRTPGTRMGHVSLHSLELQDVTGIKLGVLDQHHRCAGHEITPSGELLWFSLEFLVPSTEIALAFTRVIEELSLFCDFCGSFRFAIFAFSSAAILGSPLTQLPRLRIPRIPWHW